jgi:hypothetical protein
MLRKPARVLLFLCLLPVLVPLFLAVVLAMIVAMPCFTAALFIHVRWCAWRTDTWSYVVCSPRRGWHEFVTNNLQAALPAGVAMIWSTGRPHAAQSFVLHWLASYGNQAMKPCLVEVRPLRVRCRSLHEQLLPLKTFARKNSEVQQLLRKLIKAELSPQRVSP